MRLNSRKTNAMVVSRSRTIALGYGDLTLGDAKLEKLQSLRILEVTLDSKLPFETHLREVVSRAARSLWIARRAGKLFDYICLIYSIYNFYLKKDYMRLMYSIYNFYSTP